ncbi:glyoxalase [Streptomyces hygroscopicus subsp. hygroscopicus]|uniref:VOC family protein n=1 Tax=Streptomyces sp. KHY 26 TaxID=3097359 RepID=UPI0024A5A801|nr:VOC family protein [Streptomyces hygroscopicus]GLX54407.1 glyoxalase [Streptomyces hygroscopicus subsp. hygroscopicus]
MALAKLGVVVLDCPDPGALAGFYAGLLGGTVEVDEGGDWVELKVPGGQALAFQRAEGHTPPQWPRADGNGQQFHLDLTVPDLDAAQQEVLGLGATLLDAGEPGRSWRVYADPAGHPFCLCAC